MAFACSRHSRRSPRCCRPFAGLQRNTADPYGLGAFMTAMASGQHAKYFEDATRAFSPQGVDEGNGILGHLFGSKDLSRAVASQAAQASGVSQQILQQMLPAIASMVMGGLFKQTTNQMQAAGGFGGGGNNPLGEIIEQMMRQGGMQAPAPQPRQAPQPQNPMDNPLGKVLQTCRRRAAISAAPPSIAPSGPGRRPIQAAGQGTRSAICLARWPGTGAQQRTITGKGMEPSDQFKRGNGSAVADRRYRPGKAWSWDWAVQAGRRDPQGVGPANLWSPRTQKGHGNRTAQASDQATLRADPDRLTVAAISRSRRRVGQTVRRWRHRSARAGPISASSNPTSRRDEGAAVFQADRR